MKFANLFVVLATVAVVMLVAPPEVVGQEERAVFRNYYSWDEDLPMAPAYTVAPPLAPDTRLTAELSESCMKEPGCRWFCEEGDTMCRCQCKLVPTVGRRRFFATRRN